MASRKNKKALDTTDNSSVYRKALINTVCSCPLCSPNRGCNRQSKWSNDNECWKSNRKTQWK